MLERLARGALPVTALAEPFQVSLPAISKQLRVLERAGLVTQEKDGRVRWCRLEAEPMQHAAQWIEQYRRFWDRQLESLASYLEDAALDEGQPGPTANHQRQDPTEGD
jgi:DNA-binding transcriptional ArsR family regulator